MPIGAQGFNYPYALRPGSLTSRGQPTTARGAECYQSRTLVRLQGEHLQMRGSLFGFPAGGIVGARHP
jgi:hypothetical protein